jgi:hypothetical protein
VTEQPIAHVTLAGDRAGAYVVTEERSDGALVVAPDPLAQTLSRPLTGEPATVEQLDAQHGPLLPADDEG